MAVCRCGVPPRAPTSASRAAVPRLRRGLGAWPSKSPRAENERRKLGGGGPCPARGGGRQVWSPARGAGPERSASKAEAPGANGAGLSLLAAYFQFREMAPMSPVQPPPSSPASRGRELPLDGRPAGSRRWLELQRSPARRHGNPAARVNLEWSTEISRAASMAAATPQELLILAGVWGFGEQGPGLRGRSSSVAYGEAVLERSAFARRFWRARRCSPSSWQWRASPKLFSAESDAERPRVAVPSGLHTAPPSAS